VATFVERILSRVGDGTGNQGAERAA